MPGRFAFVPVVPPFAGEGQEEHVVSDYIARLEEMGGVRWSAEEGSDSRHPLLLLIATGGTEGAALELHEMRQAQVPGEPALIVAHPGNNSLPAALEILARLQQDGAAGRILYLRGVDDAAGWDALEEALTNAAVLSALGSTRLGLVGTPSDWLVASSPDPAIVTETWGPEVVPIDMEELTAAIDAVGAESATSADDLLSASTACVEPTAEDLAAVARVYEGLRALVEKHQLDALTVRCFDLVMERSTSGCFALSKLTDDGIIAGCEGDVVSTVGMLWAKLLTGEVPWMANPADLDVADNSLWLAHCTVPRTLVEEYSLRSHFESGLGVGIQGALPAGPVTLLRIGGAMMDEVWLAEGELTDVGTQENLCRTQARIALSRGHVQELLTAPLGNHIVMVRGHHADCFESSLTG